jgi:hypothetical protein
MIHQFDEMTLNRHPFVLPFFDPESLMLLESRAPKLSTRDKSDISELFKNRKLFPGLDDSCLRTKVEKAVCEQGPILSFATLAKDVHILVSRIHKPLSELEGVMGEMENGANDTVRRRVMTYFERLIPKPLQTLEFRQGNASSASCYETLFINLLRGNYTQLAEQDLNDIVPGGHSNNTRDMVVPIHDDPIDELPTQHGTRLSTRHGTRLFNRPSVKRFLHWPEDYECRPNLQAYTIARFLTCIFLFGEPTALTAADRTDSSANYHVAYLGNLCRQHKKDNDISNLQEIARGNGTMVSSSRSINSWRAQVYASPYSLESGSIWRATHHEASPTHDAPPQRSRRSYRRSKPGSFATPMLLEEYRRLVEPYPYDYDDEYKSVSSRQEHATNSSGQERRVVQCSPPGNSSVYSTTSSAPPRRSSTFSGLTFCGESLGSLSGCTNWDDDTVVSQRSIMDDGHLLENSLPSDELPPQINSSQPKHASAEIMFQLFNSDPEKFFVANRVSQDIEIFLKNQPCGTTYSYQVPIGDCSYDTAKTPITKQFDNFPDVEGKSRYFDAQAILICLSVGTVSVRTPTGKWVPSTVDLYTYP